MQCPACTSAIWFYTVDHISISGLFQSGWWDSEPIDFALKGGSGANSITCGNHCAVLHAGGLCGVTLEQSIGNVYLILNVLPVRTFLWVHAYFVYCACNITMCYASNVYVTASQEHVEGKYFADGVIQNAGQVMSLAVTAMMPPRLSLQIVRIPANRESQVPFVFSSLNCNQLLQVHLMFFHQSVFFHSSNNVIYHSTSCDHCAYFGKQAAFSLGEFLHDRVMHRSWQENKTYAMVPLQPMVFHVALDVWRTPAWLHEIWPSLAPPWKSHDDSRQVIPPSCVVPFKLLHKQDSIR